MDHRLHHRLHPLTAAPASHIETIRRGHEAFNRADLSWTRESVAEDVEWRPTGAFPGLEGVYKGPEAVEEWMDTIRAEWEEFKVSLSDVLREEERSVVVAERLWGRGRGSGAEAEMTVFSVYRFDPEGRITERVALTTAEEALAAMNEAREKPRNPLRREQDMFRVLLMFAVAAAIVIAVALLIGSLAGAIVGAVFLVVGLWRTWGLIQAWRRYGSDPAER